MSSAIVKDTFRPLLKKQIKAMRADNKRRINERISLQWKANNSRRFNKQVAADLEGNVSPWKDYSPNTVRNSKGEPRRRHSAYYDANGNKRKKPGKRFYSGNRSQLLRDTGRLRGSVAAIGTNADIDKVTSGYVELGSKVPYALQQHSMRRIVSLSKDDRKAFIRIYLKEMGLK